MRVLRLALAAVVVAAIPMLSSSPAHAALSGPCKASGELNGKTYDPRTFDRVTIVRKGTVHWQGSVPGNGKRAINGAVQIKLPWPIGWRSIDSWGKTSDRYSNSGKYKYDFPPEIAGFDIPLKGYHTERGITCAGAVVVQFDGGGVSNPMVIGSFVLLLITGTGLIVAFKSKVV